MDRLFALDGLRAISILAVLAAHLLPLGPKTFRLNETAGAMGMSLFFALSGFLITKNLLAGQAVADFVVRRLTRILPLAFAYLIFVFLLITYNPITLIACFFFTENYATEFLFDHLNAHFWSLCIEVHFYIAIGIAVACLGKKAIYLVVPVCIFITANRVFEGAVIDIRTHLRVDEILAGACIAVLFYHGMLNRKLSPWLFAGFGLFWFVASWPLGDWIQYFRPYASAGVVATALMLPKGRLSSALKSQPARYIAEISYALYVIHPITAYGWMSEGSTLQKYALKRPISIALAFVLSHLSTFYWESKFIKIGKNFTKRRMTKIA